MSACIPPSPTLYRKTPPPSRERRRDRLRDLLDLDLGEGLAVAVDARVAALRLVLHDADLGGAAVLDDLGRDLGSGDARGADLHVLAVSVGDHEDLEIERGTGFLLELLDVQGLAFLDQVLFSAGGDDCV